MVSGSFYPEDSIELVNAIESAFNNQTFGPGKLPPSHNRSRIYGMVSPHAGYTYSGAIAANGYYEISSSNFDSAVIIGPNHYGIGNDIAIMEGGSWLTPLGETRINSKLASQIYDSCQFINYDYLAHSRDHCIEVQLPFFQYFNRRFTFVPIILGNQDEEISFKLGKCISGVMKDEKTILVASSDFTHYESNKDAYEKDFELISSILLLDLSKFYTTLERYHVTACGYGAIGTVMKAAKEMGATRGKLLKYATSGDITGDTKSVVGYSSIIFV